MRKSVFGVAVALLLTGCELEGGANVIAPVTDVFNMIISFYFQAPQFFDTIIMAFLFYAVTDLIGQQSPVFKNKLMRTAMVLILTIGYAVFSFMTGFQLFISPIAFYVLLFVFAVYMIGHFKLIKNLESRSGYLMFALITLLPLLMIQTYLPEFYGSLPKFIKIIIYFLAIAGFVSLFAWVASFGNRRAASTPEARQALIQKNEVKKKKAKEHDKKIEHIEEHIDKEVDDELKKEEKIKSKIAAEEQTREIEKKKFSEDINHLKKDIDNRDVEDAAKEINTMERDLQDLESIDEEEINDLDHDIESEKKIEKALTTEEAAEKTELADVIEELKDDLEEETQIGENIGDEQNIIKEADTIQKEENKVKEEIEIAKTEERIETEQEKKLKKEIGRIHKILEHLKAIKNCIIHNNEQEDDLAHFMIEGRNIYLENLGAKKIENKDNTKSVTTHITNYQKLLEKNERELEILQKKQEEQSGA